jgi:hypothetical protein
MHRHMPPQTTRTGYDDSSQATGRTVIPVSAPQNNLLAAWYFVQHSLHYPVFKQQHTTHILPSPPLSFFLSLSLLSLNQQDKLRPHFHVQHAFVYCGVDTPRQHVTALRIAISISIWRQWVLYLRLKLVDIRQSTHPIIFTRVKLPLSRYNSRQWTHVQPRVFWRDKPMKSGHMSLVHTARNSNSKGQSPSWEADICSADKRYSLSFMGKCFYCVTTSTH